MEVKKKFVEVKDPKTLPVDEQVVVLTGGSLHVAYWDAKVGKAIVGVSKSQPLYTSKVDKIWRLV